MKLDDLFEQIKIMKVDFDKDGEFNPSGINLYISTLKGKMKTKKEIDTKNIMSELGKAIDKSFGDTDYNEELKNATNLFITEIRTKNKSFTFNFLKNLLSLKAYCIKKGHKPLGSNDGSSNLYSFWNNVNKTQRTEEQTKLIEDSISDFKKKEELNNEEHFKNYYAELAAYCKSEGFIPTQISHERLYGFYINKSNVERTEEQNRLIQEIADTYPLKIDFDKQQNFDKNYKELEDYCDENGYLPDSNESTHAQKLYNFYQNNANTVRTAEQNRLIEEIVETYPTKDEVNRGNYFEKMHEALVKYCEKHKALPSKSKNNVLDKFYTKYSRNPKTEEQKKLMDTITEKYTHLKEFTYAEKVAIIYDNIENLVERLSNNKITSIIPFFEEIEKNFNLLYSGEKETFEKQNPEIMAFCNHVLEQNYSEFSEKKTAEILNKLLDIIDDFNDLNQGQITGDYLAWNLNKELYLEENSEEGDKEYSLDIKKDIASLQKVLQYLKFTNQTKQTKKRIIGGFHVFLEHIDFQDKDLDKNTESAYKAELLSHITLFFENFNPDDFQEMIEELKGKNEKVFVDTILTTINNSAMVIPNDKDTIPSKVFEKNADGKWVYDMKTSGRLDNHYSYNGRRITGSVTVSDANGWEGGQLLFHPMKDKLLEHDLFDFVKREVEGGNYKEPTGFKKGTLLAGLRISNLSKDFFEGNGMGRSIKFEIVDDKLFGENNLFEDKSLFRRQLEKMENGFLITKTILETTIGRRKNAGKKFENLNMFREKVVKTSKAGYQETMEEYKKIMHGVEDAPLNKEDLREVAKGHIFTLRSLTLPSLEMSENELLIELYLNTEKKIYEKWINKELTDVFIEQIELKNPLVKSSVSTIMENNNKKALGNFLVDFLLGDFKIVSKKKTDADREFAQKVFEFYKAEGEKYELPELTLEFFKKMTRNKYEEMFTNLLSDTYKARKTAILKENTKIKDEIEAEDEKFARNAEYITHKGEEITFVKTPNTGIPAILAEGIISAVNKHGMEAIKELRVPYNSEDLLKLLKERKEEVSLDKDEYEKIISVLKQGTTKGKRP